MEEKTEKNSKKDGQEKNGINIFKYVHSKINRKNLSQCLSLLREFCKAIKDIFTTPKENEIYSGLGPSKEADSKGVYSEALKYAIENPEIKNIAVTGNYGAGKSSVIKTFFDKLENKKYNPIFVSLAAFNVNDENGNKPPSGGEELLKKQNEFQHTLEKSILQQLFYQVNERKVPLSRFKRITKHSKLLLHFASFVTICIILTLSFVFLPNLIDNVKDNFNFIGEKIPKWIWHLITYIALLGIYAIVYKILFMLKTKINISKFKIKDAEVEINDKAESVFNKYLDEIIYFFQVTNYGVVIIEDLDRYEGDAFFIFQKLRELNTLINSSNQVKQSVNFIFAIKDDFFSDYEERTKFFDYIVPIIPISSSANSNETLWKRLKYLENVGKIKIKFSKDFINDISIIIEDKRLIDNIINEFIIYKNSLNNDCLDDKQLFSIIVYKNIYPIMYASLQKNNGNIAEIFKNKNQKKEKLIQELNKQIEELTQKKLKVKQESLNSIKELKLVLAGSVYEFNEYSGLEGKFKFNKDSIKIKSFIDSINDIEMISNSNIEFTKNSGYYGDMNEDEVFKLFGNKSNFIERWKNIEKGKESKLKEIQDEIDNLNEKIKNVEKLKIKQLIDTYGEKEIFDEKTKNVEKFLIRKGYITEEYMDYITIFISGDLTKKDNEFVSAVKMGEKLPYDYELEKIANIIKKLGTDDWEKAEILNYDLLNYLIENSINDKIQKIINVLKNNDKEALNFIDGYNEKYVTNANKFSKILVESYDNLWKNISKKMEDKKYIDNWVVLFLLNKHSLDYVDEEFCEYISNHKSFDKLIVDTQISTIVDSLEYLNIKLSNILEISNKEIFMQIYEKRLYKLNIQMIKNVLTFLEVDFSNFETKNLSIILNCDNDLRAYVLDEFNEYFDYCYTLTESNDDEEEAIIEILNNNNISINSKKKIINNEKFNEYKVDMLEGDFKEELIKEIMIKDKLKIDYNNILAIQKDGEELDQKIIDHISRHINEYSNKNIYESSSVYDKHTIDSFIFKYICNASVNIDDFKVIVKTFNMKIDVVEGVQNTKLEYLIMQNLVELSADNFEYIQENIPNMLLEYSINNLSDLIGDIEKYNIDDIVDELLVNKNVTRDDKIKILEKIETNDLKSSTIIYLVIKEEIYIDNDDVNKQIIQNKYITFSEKMQFLKIVIKNINNKDLGTEYLHLMSSYDNDYKHINTEYKLSNIRDKYIDLELCEILKSDGYISSYKKGKCNNYILYNKGG